MDRSFNIVWYVRFGPIGYLMGIYARAESEINEENRVEEKKRPNQLTMVILRFKHARAISIAITCIMCILYFMIRISLTWWIQQKTTDLEISIASCAIHMSERVNHLTAQSDGFLTYRRCWCFFLVLSHVYIGANYISPTLFVPRLHLVINSLLFRLCFALSTNMCFFYQINDELEKFIEEKKMNSECEQ